MPRLTIYSKPDCHLCHEMKAVVERVARSRSNVPLEEIDISNDAVLLERYGQEIPVLMIDGTKVAKYRVTEAELTRMLDSRDDRQG
jgi:glutaredoxin